MIMLSHEAIRASMARRARLYRWHAPRYQLAMMDALASVWAGPHERLLDVGGGTGIVAQLVQDHLPVGEVVSVDVEQRFLPDLSVRTLVYDGHALPFADNSFDAATINNVLHHVPLADRRALLGDIRRVVSGPLYVKDHVSLGRLDDARLAVLDWIGNTPFRGMVRADYLNEADWRDLATAGGYRIAERVHGVYRGGAYAALFPNRLEVVMKWLPDGSHAR